MVTQKSLPGAAFHATVWDGFGASIEKIAAAAPHAGFFNAIADDLPKGFLLPEGEVQAESIGLPVKVLREAIVIFKKPFFIKTVEFFIFDWQIKGLSLHKKLVVFF